MELEPESINVLEVTHSKLQLAARAYLAYALTFTPQELLLRTKMAEWLPNEVIDCHVHTNAEEHLRFLPDAIYQHVMSTFPWFSITDSLSLRSKLMPGVQIRTLRFPHAFRGNDHRAANDYLLKFAPPGDWVALYGIPDDLEYTISMLDHPRVVALKMYHRYFDPPARNIYDYFKPEILEVAQARSKPIILHLPTLITESIDQLARLAQDFPKLQIVVAHMGHANKKGIIGLYDVYRAAAVFPNVVLDTSLISSPDVFTLGLEIFGAERILYGSDEPLNLIRAMYYEHPLLGQRIAALYPYHWHTSDKYAASKDLAGEVILLHYQELTALKVAIDSLSSEKRDYAKLAIFGDNARRIFNL